MRLAFVHISHSHANVLSTVSNQFVVSFYSVFTFIVFVGWRAYEQCTHTSFHLQNVRGGRTMRTIIHCYKGYGSGKPHRARVCVCVSVSKNTILLLLILSISVALFIFIPIFFFVPFDGGFGWQESPRNKNGKPQRIPLSTPMYRINSN